MRFEAFVAFRYTRSKRKNRVVSLITLISVAGVSVGVTALIVVMSVMTGFDIELTAAVIGNRAHLTVQDTFGRPFADSDATIRELESRFPEIKASSPFTEIWGLLKTQRGKQNRYEPADIIGIDVERESAFSQLADNLTHKGGRTLGAGNLPGNKEIVLGCILADKLGVRAGDEIDVITPNGRPTPLGWQSAGSVRLTVSGISQALMSDFDTVYAYVDLETASLLKSQEGVDAIKCNLSGASGMRGARDARLLADRIEDGMGFRVRTFYESQQAFFEALVQEKVAMFIILAFIILVAAFNIASTLIMVVMEKRRDIGILRTLGVSSTSVMILFVLEGLYIGLGGSLLGVTVGTLLAYNLNPVARVIANALGLDLFNSTIYFFDHIPVAVVPEDVLWITLATVVLTFLSTLYPAWSASRLDPVDALRYE